MTGVLYLDKPAGATSFSAANAAKRKVGAKKAGHTGTLDPMATGVLVVMLGGATRFIDYISDKDKSYEARLLLGMTTDTLDTSGNVLSRSDSIASKAEFEKALFSFQGRIKQVPPMYSAIKSGGKKLYEYARLGVEIEREAREVTIDSLKLLSYDEIAGIYDISVDCSAGTYIRSLADDIGRILGCGAVLSALRRTKANGVSIDECSTLDEIDPACVRKIDDLLVYPSVTVTAAQTKRFCCGGELDAERVRGLNGAGIYKVYSPEGELLGLGDLDSELTRLSPEKILVR